MLYKNHFLLLPILLLIVSCDVNPLEAAGEQKIQIRVWRNNTPNLLESVEFSTGELKLDVANENVVDFDMKVIDGVVYVTYTTDKEVYTAYRPGIVWTASTMPHELTNAAGDIPVSIVKYSRIRTASKEIFIGYNNQNQEINRFERSISLTGKWVRLFEGIQDPSNANGDMLWVQVLAPNTPMEVNNPIIFPFEQSKSTIAMVSNQNRIIIITDFNRDGLVDFIVDDLPVGVVMSKIEQLNTWTHEGNLFLSMVIDSKSIITGSFTPAGAWILRSRYTQRNPIEEFRVEMGREFPYAVWVDPSLQSLIVSIYQTSDDNKTAWVEIDRLNSVKIPKLSIRVNRSIGGDIVEHAYIGTVNETHNFFQLFRTLQLNSEFAGPPIAEWNENYDITGNDSGQVLFVRADFNRQLSFAGLNTFQQWEQIQRNSPPPVLINPNSSIEAMFINDGHALIGFRTSNGALYLLSGIR